MLKPGLKARVIGRHYTTPCKGETKNNPKKHERREPFQIRGAN
jgi:hypothetical protein